MQTEKTRISALKINKVTNNSYKIRWYHDLIRPYIYNYFLYKGEIKMLDAKYNHTKVEEGKYDKWLNKEYFKCNENSTKKPFLTVLLPPNVI